MGLAACGGGTNNNEPKISGSTTTAPTTLITIEITTTTLFVYDATIEPNNEVITWDIEPMSPTIKYVNITSDFLKIRKGPGTTYEQVGALTRGMQVIVTGVTESDWYQLEDGYYVSGEFLKESPV
jgi:uncharacterized protein YgiM (DUF1202 family)